MIGDTTVKVNFEQWGNLLGIDMSDVGQRGRDLFDGTVKAIDDGVDLGAQAR